jgi:energy-coupling factor transport system ATP-binding protein
MRCAIKIDNVTFTYAAGHHPALNGLSLDVPPGQICGVVGRAGAGKSTLCYLCTGFLPQFYHGQIAGSAHCDGQDAIQQQVADLVRHVGLVGSNPFSQISGARFTVYEEIGFGLENLGLPRAEISARIEWALDALKLTELRDRSPYALSGGQQQRMVLAATLAMRPPVLVLDEPTAQLDPFATEELAEILRTLAAQGITILFAEHRLEWTAALAERIIVLDAGQIIADGAPESTLTSQILRDRGIGWPRPASLAEQARCRGYWPVARPLPVTLAGLMAGLGATSDDGRPPLPNQVRQDTLPAALHTDAPIQNHIIALEEVRFAYPSGVAALRGVSLEIGAGERIALLGRNGAGKSTLVRHLNGLLTPQSGRVIVANTDAARTTVARCARHVGIVFQDIRNQLFARSVRDELRFGPRNLGYSAAQIEELVDQALRALDLRDVAAEHPYDLPPTRRRLVAIAAVLAMNSTLLVLDEPTAGLDNASIARLVALAHDLAAQGKSVLVVSHDLDFCLEALDRVVLLREGGITLDSRWSELDGAALDILAVDVGLPSSLQVIRDLNLPTDAELATLLLQQESGEKQ